MSQWYYQIHGEVYGPLSLEQLREKASLGEIQADTLVRGEQEQWNAAAEVEGVLPENAIRIATLPAEGPAWPESASDGSEVAEGEHCVARSPLGLRPCADCGRMVSQRASMCPECGRSFHENAFTVPQRGEHPVPILVLFAVLSMAYVLLTPLIVYQLTTRLLFDAQGEAALESATPILATALYVASMIGCTVLGGAVGKPRGAYYTGLLLGLFFGPLGVFAAFAIDKRAQCPHCYSRLDGPARECPACHSRLLWEYRTQWY